LNFWANPVTYAFANQPLGWRRYTVYRLKTLKKMRELWHRRGQHDHVMDPANVQGSLLIGKLFISGPLHR
jgi:hypothetical protein